MVSAYGSGGLSYGHKHGPYVFVDSNQITGGRSVSRVPYCTNITGACQNAAFCPVVSTTVT
jgi:hypothetical protein